MKRVPRADFALSVPWSGITGRPETQTASPRVIERVTRVVTEVPSPDQPVTRLLWNFSWDPGILRPLETAILKLDVPGVTPGMPVAVGCPYALEFGQLSAQVVNWRTVQVSLTNLSLETIEPGGGNWRLAIFL